MRVLNAIVLIAIGLAVGVAFGVFLTFNLKESGEVDEVGTTTVRAYPTWPSINTPTWPRTWAPTWPPRTTRTPEATETPTVKPTEKLTEKPTDKPTATEPPATEPTETEPSSEPEPVSVCLTERCNATARMYSENLNKDVNPCDDFYSFACGNFERHNALPGDKSRLTSFDKIAKDVTKLLIRKLEEKLPEGEPRPLKFIRTLFQKATDESYLGRNDFTKLVAKYEDLSKLETFEDFIIGSVRDFAIPSLLSFVVITDPEEPTRRIVSIDQPQFTISKKYLLDETGERARVIREAYKKYIQSALQLFDPDLEDSDAKIMANNILALEKALAGIAAKDEERWNYEELYKYEKKALKYEVDGIDLEKIIDRIVGTEDVEKVIVMDMDYFKNLAKVLNGKDVDVRDFLTWMLVQSYARTISSKFLYIEYEFMKVKSGLAKKPNVKETVISMLISAVPNVMGRFYIDATGFDEWDKLKVNSMAEELKRSMAKIIEETEWMDETTKNKARVKLNTMKVNMAYPEWIIKDQELTKSFGLRTTEDEDAFDLVFKLNKFLVTDKINKLKEEIYHEREWPMSPALVNAAYEPAQNSITFPAAIFRGAFYNSGRPDYSNYAAIGTIIGHEITHASDGLGSQYGPDGAFVGWGWWSEVTDENFSEAAKKMVKQYSDIVDSRTGMNLNGVNTQGENIADNGGVRVAYNAYFSMNMNEKKLVGFEDWSAEKMFFLSYANVWCGLITDENLRERINTDPHSPAEYRVNVPLKNFEGFSNAFQCKKGDKMNPDDRVRVW